MLRFDPKQISFVLQVSLGSYFEIISTGSTIYMDASFFITFLHLYSHSKFTRYVNVFVSALSNVGFCITGSTHAVQCYL